MKVKLTAEQAAQIVVNAINASVGAGMGMLHYKKDTVYGADDLKDYVGCGYEEAIATPERLFVDYFHGRMVKLKMRADSDGFFHIPEDAPRMDYQSWVRIYPTYQSLFDSVLNT